MKQHEETFNLELEDERLKDKIEPNSSFTHGLFPVRAQIRDDYGYLMRLYRRGFVPKEDSLAVRYKP